MVPCVVDHAELAGGDAVDGLCGVDDVGSWLVGQGFECGGVEVGGVANLDSYPTLGPFPITREGSFDASRRQHAVEAVEVADEEVLLVGRRGVVAVGDVEDVLLHIFLHHKHGTATDATYVANQLTRIMPVRFH